VSNKPLNLKIRELRIKARLVREALAAVLNVSVVDYGGVEDGEIEVYKNDQIMEDLCNFYSMPITFFFPKEDERLAPVLSLVNKDKT
jgi:transcriptional regulator with XRE-family HTH domain